MKSKIFSFLIVFMILAFEVNAQKDEVPIPVMPGNSISNETLDTMWVLHSTKQFKKVAIALKNQGLYKELSKKNEQLVDSLQLLNDERSTYIDSLKNERQLYIQQVDKCEADLGLLGEMNMKQSKYTRIAIIVGSATTVTAFIVGFILGIK